MLKKLLFFILLISGVIGFAQDFPEKEKKYDQDILSFLMDTTQKDSISLETFLIYSKPFSKWDVRPLGREKVWCLDTVHGVSEVPNFFFGIFCHTYNVSEMASRKIPNDFLQKGIDSKTSLQSYLNENLKKFDQLSKFISRSKNGLFVSYNDIQKVDNLYREKNTYWKYNIPKDSPFPISNVVESNVKEKFSKEQIRILELIKELKIYAAYKTTKGIFYLTDGLTDNSYGFYFNPKGNMETDHFLFRIMKSEKINDNYFYYVAN